MVKATYVGTVGGFVKWGEKKISAKEAVKVLKKKKFNISTKRGLTALKK
jgi:hypothetical protein